MAKVGDPRQAGPEVTPAMIEAGVPAFWPCEAPINDNEDALVVRIYRAMERARAGGPVGSKECDQPCTKELQPGL